MTAPAGMQALLAAVADALPHRPALNGMCAAVWRDPTDRALVACADVAEPGRDWCGWHSDRRNGPPVFAFYDRHEATRVEHPTTTGDHP